MASGLDTDGVYLQKEVLVPQECVSVSGFSYQLVCESCRLYYFSVKHTFTKLNLECNRLLNHSLTRS